MAFDIGTLRFYALLLLGSAAFAAVAGMFSSWLDRKVTALVQARRGPPLLQPFYDFLKLMGKENLRPLGATWAYTVMPLVALAAVSLAATILLGQVLWQNGLLASQGGGSAHGLVGDLVVVLYLLAVPSLALVMGASASNNPFASVGASREMKLMCYELPLLLAVAAALVLAAGRERSFAREVQRQADAAVADASSPLVSPERKQREAEDALVELCAKASPDKGESLRGLWAEFQGPGVSRDSAAQAGERFRKTFEEIKGGLPDETAAAVAAQEKECRRLALLAPKGGPVTAAVPLRFDGVLALRGAGPGDSGQLLAERAAGRIGSLAGARVRELSGIAVSYSDLSARLKAAAALGRREPAGMGDCREMLVAVEKARRLAQLPDQREILDRLARFMAAAERQVREAADKGDRALMALQLQALADECEERSQRFAEGWRTYDAQARATQAGADRLLARDGDGYRHLSGAALAAAVRPSPAGKWLGLAALALGVVVAFFCAQAKLGLAPFDCAEAETELAGGVFIEYGGPLLGIWKLSRHMLLFLLPVFIGLVFLGGFRFSVPGGTSTGDLLQAGVSLLKYAGILVGFVLVRNTNPRVRIDQAMRFFLGPLTLLAALALALALAAGAGWLD